MHDISKVKNWTSIIANHFPISKGSYRVHNEIWTLNPMRADNNVGSFSINEETGQWFDFATGEKGSVVDYLVHTGKTVAEAIKIICESDGQSFSSYENKLVEPPHKNKSGKITNYKKATSKEAEYFANSIIPYYKQNLNLECEGYWPWQDLEGNVLLITARFLDSKKKKTFRQFHYTGKFWRGGAPNLEKTPLLFFQSGVQIQPKLAVKQDNFIIVEGEKCAENLSCVTPEVVATWNGGASNVHNAHWTWLENKKVIIWPDNDSPGIKAAKIIKNTIINSYIAYPPSGKPKKWDCVDAIEENFDYKNFLTDSFAKSTGAVIEELTPPFKVLGWDKSNTKIWFLPSNDLAYSPFFIKSDRIGKTTFLRLAPLSWWVKAFPSETLRSFDITLAIDWFFRYADKIGFYEEIHTRGVGAWQEDDTFILNTGNVIVNENLETQKYTAQDYKKYSYIGDTTKLASITRDPASDEISSKLLETVNDCKFETNLDSMAMTGWLMTAPVAGALNWRSHLWLTGEAGSGKSFLLNEIVSPIIGTHVEGTASSTVVSIRNQIGNNTLPVVLDEMDSHGKKDLSSKIQSITDLARISSSGGQITKADTENGGVARFNLRSQFLYASVLPELTNTADESRFTYARLKKDSNKSSDVSWLTSSVCASLRTRAFINLPTLKKNIAFIKKEMLSINYSAREADQLSTLLAGFVLAYQTSELHVDHHLWRMIEEELIELKTKESQEIMSEEDKFFSFFLSRTIQEEHAHYSIADLLNKEASLTEDTAYSERLLSQHGIKIVNTKTGDKQLAIHASSYNLAKLFSESAYMANAKEMFARHSIFREFKETKSVRMAGQTTSSWLVPFSKIQSRYGMTSEDFNQNSSVPF